MDSSRGRNERQQPHESPVKESPLWMDHKTAQRQAARSIVDSTAKNTQRVVGFECSALRCAHWEPTISLRELALSRLPGKQVDNQVAYFREIICCRQSTSALRSFSGGRHDARLMHRTLSNRRFFGKSAYLSSAHQMQLQNCVIALAKCVSVWFDLFVDFNGHWLSRRRAT